VAIVATWHEALNAGDVERLLIAIRRKPPHARSKLSIVERHNPAVAHLHGVHRTVESIARRGLAPYLRQKQKVLSSSVSGADWL
jgi:hypothetical protein